MKTKLTLATFLILTALACSKEKPDKTFTIRGRIVKSCNGEPFPDVSLEMNARYASTWPFPNTNVFTDTNEVLTDHDGNFELKYNWQVEKTELVVYAQAKQAGWACKQYLIGIPLNRDLDLGELPLFVPLVHRDLSVLLSTSTAYSSTDTLHYFVSGKNVHGGLRKAGPFYDGQVLDTMKCYPLPILVDSTVYSIFSHRRAVTYRIGKSGPYRTVQGHFGMRGCNPEGPIILSLD
jgi:hypothetical protein